MDIIKFKIDFLLEEEKCQVIFFDAEGFLTDSCDTLLPLSSYKGTGKRIPLPILDNIGEILADIPEREQLIFPKVEVHFAGYPIQIFDFILIRKYEGEKVYYVCIIRDYVVRYQHLQEIVTTQRATAMEKEFLEIKHEKTALENALINLKNKELEIARAIKNDFFAKASHELRTPVNGIIGLAEILIKTSSGEQKEYLAALGQIANQLKTVVNDLLDLSKLEEKKITFEHTDFQPKEVLNNIYLSLKPLAETKKVKISFDVAAQVPDYLKGDSVRISQVVYNLVGNALKFTEKGEVSVGVRVGHISEDGRTYTLHFAVSDTGIGIAPEKLVHIFEPYSQENDEIYRIYGGTGLGLAIAKQLIEAMGGQINAQSEQGVGTTFYFSIPLLLGKATSVAAETSFQSYHNCCVLVADDNNINVMVIAKKMQEIGFEVDTASNGQETLDKLGQKRYDLLCLDVDMPVLDGYQTAKIIRAMPDIHYQELPIFLMTAYSYTDIRSKVKDISISDFLTKPFDMATFLQKLALHLPNDKAKSKTNSLNLDQINEFTQGNQAFEKVLLMEIIATMQAMQTEYKEAIDSPEIGKHIRNLLHKHHITFTLLTEDTLHKKIENTVESLQKSADARATKKELISAVHLLSEEAISLLKAKLAAP